MSDTIGREMRTMAFLMTDLVGSSEMLSYSELEGLRALERHDQIAAEICAESGARLVRERGEGDSLFIVSEVPSILLQTALNLRERIERESWPDGRTIKMRMALHVGEGQFRDETYYGVQVHKSGRLRSLAHAGQILASEAFATVVRASVEGARLVSLGAHELRGFKESEVIYQIEKTGVPEHHPALDSARSMRHHFPAMLSDFVGRGDVIPIVQEATQQHRLVNLVGAGGVGKTRLAVEAVEDLDAAFTQFWFISLADVASSEDLNDRIHHAFDQPQANLSAENLFRPYQKKSILLVLDGCERCQGALAEWITQALRAAPLLHILCTSQKALGLEGEKLIQIRPLDVARPTESTERILESDAVRFFLLRCQDHDPEFEPEEEELPVLAEICGQLDGLPLAMRLAASRTRTMGLRDLNDKLGKSLSILQDRRRPVHGAQRTLSDTVEWSFQMLTDGAQELLQNLCVFARTWLASAGEEVVMTGCEMQEGDFYEALSELVDGSLVTFDRKARRYQMFGTLRAILLEKPEVWDRVHKLQSVHAAWFADRAKEASPDEFLADLDNYRSALAYLAETPGEGLTTARMFLDSSRGFEANGRARYALKTVSKLPSVLSPEDPLTIEFLRHGGIMALNLAEADLAIDWLNKALELAQCSGDRKSEAAVLNNLANVYSNHLSNYEKASEHYRTALEINEADGRRLWVAFNHINLGVAYERMSQYDPAKEAFRMAQTVLAEIKEPAYMFYPLAGLGSVSNAEQDADQAFAYYLEALELHSGAADRVAVPTLIEGLWEALASMGRWRTAARLYGLESRLRQVWDVPLPRADAPEHREKIEAVRRSHGRAVVDAEIRTGAQTLIGEDIVEVVLRMLQEPEPQPS